MNRVKLNRWLIALVTVAMLALVFMPDEKEISIEIDSEHPEADYTMENVIITQYAKNGEQNHQLNTEKMVHYNQTYVELDGESNDTQENKTSLNSEVSILVEPNITYQSEQGAWMLTAKQGRMTNQQSLLFLQDEVQLTEKITDSQESTQVTTNDLQINLLTKIAETEKDVILVAENLTAKSQGMRIDMKNSKLYLLSNVRSQLTKIKN